MNKYVTSACIASACGLCLALGYNFARLENRILHEEMVPSEQGEPTKTVCATASIDKEQVRVIEFTNLHEIAETRTVVVTNVVEVPPPVKPRHLSMRKTAPYSVICEVLSGERLQRELSNRGARVISFGRASKAMVEASDETVAKLKDSGLFDVLEVSPREKVRAGAKGAVIVYPMSSIDTGVVVHAIELIGGNPKAEIVGGRTIVRATLDEKGVLAIAERGDVRRIEKDEGAGKASVR